MFFQDNIGKDAGAERQSKQEENRRLAADQYAPMRHYELAKDGNSGGRRKQSNKRARRIA